MRADPDAETGGGGKDPTGLKGTAAIILEDPRDADRACALARERRGITLLPATPDAGWELEKRGMPFQPVEGFSDLVLLSSTGMKNFEITRDLCTVIDREIQERFPGPWPVAPCPAADNFFALKVLYDGLTLRTRILLDVGRVLNPDTIVFFTGSPQIPGAHQQVPGPLVPGEQVYGWLLERSSWPFQTHRIPRGETGGGEPSLPPPALAGAGEIAKALAHASFLYDIMYLVKRGRFGKAAGLGLSAPLNHLRPSEGLLVSGYSYSWNDLVPALAREGYRVGHLWLDRVPSRTTTPMGTGMLRQVLGEILPRFSSCAGVDLSGPLHDRLLAILWDYLASFPDLSREITARLAANRPRAILCGTKDSWRDHLLARCAGPLGIPVVSWQHGSQGFFPAPMMEYIELQGSTVHLCFGEQVRAMIGRDFPRQAGLRVVPVGSYQLQELAARPPPEPPEIDLLYATTNYALGSLYVGGIGDGIIPDNDFWETQKAILQVIGESGRSAVLKLHPGQYVSSHIREFIGSRGYTNISVIRNERTFPDLVGHARAVVIDCPSTTLLEAVAGGRDVLVLLRHVPLAGPARDLLRKRAYLDDDRGGFLHLLRHYINGEETGQHPGRGNTDFLEGYGVHRLDGKVEERALAVIRDPGKRTAAG
jgi:hypothetical protein